MQERPSIKSMAEYLGISEARFREGTLRLVEAGYLTPTEIRDDGVSFNINGTPEPMSIDITDVSKTDFRLERDY